MGGIVSRSWDEWRARKNWFWPRSSLRVVRVVVAVVPHDLGPPRTVHKTPVWPGSGGSIWSVFFVVATGLILLRFRSFCFVLFTIETYQKVLHLGLDSGHVPMLPFDWFGCASSRHRPRHPPRGHHGHLVPTIRLPRPHG